MGCVTDLTGVYIRRVPATLPTSTSRLDYRRIQQVASFDELISTTFKDGINALCWSRTLAGDFDEVVRALMAGDGIATLDEPRIRALELSPAGRRAANAMIEDYCLLQDRGLSPVLDCIQAYPRDEDAEVIPTDVYSFHADSAPVEADTYLCTYSGATSEGLPNEEAQRHVDIPETRARLLELFGGADDDDFATFLSENCYNLHYAPTADARPYRFGVGNLWRIACDYPGSPVPPCIHRAPDNLPGDPPRLLLIS